MTREIKFRAFIKSEECYRDVMSIKYDIYGKIEGVWVYRALVDGRDSNYYAIEDIVLEQYTGLKDKNDKKIYEGDIVSELVGDYRYSTAIKGVIEQYKGSWAIRWGDTRNGYSQLYYEQTVCEIIGNIHENPELLEGER